MKIIKSYNTFSNESMNNKLTERNFVVDIINYKFQLFIGKHLVSESRFNIEQPDEWFNQKYVTLSNVKTIKRFQGKGYAKYLLEHIFDYVKNEFKINIITLLVYKNNYKAVNLYLKCGFEIYIDYDENNDGSGDPCYTLIKNLP